MEEELLKTKRPPYAGTPRDLSFREFLSLYANSFPIDSKIGFDQLNNVFFRAKRRGVEKSIVI